MPLKQIILLLLLYTHSCKGWLFDFTFARAPFVLMISAAGDARDTGRSIDDSFERTIALSFAQEVRNKLIEYPHLKIILNRDAYDILTPFHNANLANTMQVDLCISIHCYQHLQEIPSITLYQFSYNDSFILKAEDLSFYTFDTIYLLNEKKTFKWATMLANTLKEYPLLTLKGVYKLPFKPLIGIKAPAIAIEIGGKYTNDWQQCVTPLVESLLKVIHD